MLPSLTYYECLHLQGIDRLVEYEADNSYRSIDIAELNRHFIEYLNFGGYPEIISSPAIRSVFCRFLGSDIVDKVLMRDIPRLYGIQDTRELNSLFVPLAHNTAGEVSFDSLLGECNCRGRVCERHHLERPRLVQPLDDVALVRLEPIELRCRYRPQIQAVDRRALDQPFA